MLKVGLTGGIGSGKTVVCKVFEALHVPVYNADLAARNLLHNSKGLAEKVIVHFGPSICQKNGDIDRSRLGEVVFKDASSLAALNAILHPAVNEDFSLWLGDKAGHDYIIKEAAILFESGSYKDMDCIISVYAGLDVRKQRVVERDGLTPDQFMLRESNQMEEEVKCKKADYVIDNQGAQPILPQVLKIHEGFISEPNT
jgi:dephospho-CoA kinase